LGGISPRSEVVLALARRGEAPQGRAHVEEHQRGEGEAVGDRDRDEASVADREDLTLLGGDVGLLDRRALGPVGGGEKRGRVLAPARRFLPGRRQHLAVAAEDRRSAQVG
jgi:hypothetical protein